MERGRKQKTTAILLAALFVAFLLTGCNEPQEGYEAIAGTWEMTEITAGARQVAADEYKKAASASSVPTLTFEETGRVTLDMDGDTGTGSWVQDGIYYALTYVRDGEETTQAIQLDDDTLVMEQDGYVLTYEKR